MMTHEMQFARERRFMMWNASTFALFVIGLLYISGGWLFHSKAAVLLATLSAAAGCFCNFSKAFEVRGDGTSFRLGFARPLFALSFAFGLASFAALVAAAFTTGAL